MHISLQRMTGEHFRAIRSPVTVNLTKIPAGLYFIAGRNEVEPRLGANGAAKSTLFVDLVYWVLTGKTARSQRPGADVENWHTDEPPSGTLQFLIDGQLRQITRTRKPIRLVMDGRNVTQDEVDDLLPLAEAALRRTLLIDQFSQKFLDLRAEDKSRIFSETLNLDMWVQGANKAGTMVTQFEGKLQRLRVHQSGLEAAVVEVRDQLGEAKNREIGVEAELNEQLKVLNKQRKEKAAVSNTLEAELNDARAYVAEVNVEPEIELNQRKVAARNIQREHIAAVSKEASLKDHVARLEIQVQRHSEAAKNKVCAECGQSVTDEHLEWRAAQLIAEFDEDKLALVEMTERVKQLVGQAEDNNTRITELNNELVEYHRRHGLLKVAIEKAQTALRELNSVRFQIDQLKEQINPFTKMVLSLTDRLKELRSEVWEVKQDVEKLEAEAEIYRFWQKGFRDIRLEQIDQTLMELEIAVNRHAATLGLDGWEVQFSTEREKASGGISHTFNVTLYPPGQQEPVSWESYSGGESQRLQLAVTFGLAEVLLARGGISTDFEVLDEPTIHMAQEGIEDLLECLRDRATELNRRIFLIDHHALSVGAFDGMLTVVKKKDGIHLEPDNVLSSITQRERVRL